MWGEWVWGAGAGSVRLHLRGITALTCRCQLTRSQERSLGCCWVDRRWDPFVDSELDGFPSVGGEKGSRADLS